MTRGKGQWRRRHIEKLPEMELKKTYRISVRQKAMIGIDEACEQLGVPRNDLLEALMMNFIMDFKQSLKGSNLKPDF